MSTFIQSVPTLVSQTPCRRARKTQRCCRLCVREWKTMHRWPRRRVRRRRHTHHGGGGELWAWPWRAKKTVLFLQPTSAQDNQGRRQQQWRGVGGGGGLENFSCATAPPSGTTFLCLFDAMENQPSSGRWKNGAKNTIFKEREETLFCSLARAISNSYGGRFNKNLSRKSQRKLALAMMDRIVRKFCLV